MKKIYITRNSQYAPIIGNWEPESQYLFTRLIKKNQIVFDFGANIGIHTLLFSKLVGKKGTVVAFEPLEENIFELERNISVNSCKNVVLKNCAVGNYIGKANFYLGHHNTQGSLLKESNSAFDKSSISVDIVTLDHFVSGNPNLIPDFLKIDIEGAEMELLQGSKLFFKSYRPTIFIESHSITNAKYITDFFSELGYKFYKQSKDGYDHKLKLKFLSEVIDKSELFADTNGNGTLILLYKD